MAKRLALLVGNGRHGNQVLKRLKTMDDAISIGIQEHLPSGQDVDFIVPEDFDTRYILETIQSEKVREVVLAGDLGALRSPPAPAEKREPLDYIEELKKELDEIDIVHKLASDEWPELLPRHGIWTDMLNRAPDDDTLRKLVSQAVEHAAAHTRKARQCVVFDDTEIISDEEQNTDTLLERTAGIRKPYSATRTLVKICPPTRTATLDAPVVGIDTIERCEDANVDCLIVDCKHGTIANSESFNGGGAHFIQIATQRKIAVIGVYPEDYT